MPMLLDSVESEIATVHPRRCFLEDETDVPVLSCLMRGHMYNVVDGFLIRMLTHIGDL